LLLCGGRKEYEGDARGQLIALTPKGRALQKEMWPAYREAVRKQLNALTKCQIEDLSKLLGLLIRKEGG
jgi:DNA-binding MarR family transcriptional regulator